MEAGTSIEATPPRREPVGRLLEVMMASRLALAVGSLGIALGLDRLGGGITVTEWDGFYGTVVVAFVATLVYYPFAGRLRRPRFFAPLNLLTDVGLVSALVLFSGARDSVFTFFYAVVAAYAAVLLPRAGALAWSGVASVAYGAVLVAGQRGWVETGSGPQPPEVLLGAWTVLTAALVLVSSLASFLSAELWRTGLALAQRTSDLARLETLHQRTVESLMSGLLTTDSAGRVTSFNPEAERITGCRAAEVQGRDMDEALPGVRSVIEVGEDVRTRARMLHHARGGATLHLGVGAYVLRNAEGEPDGHVVIFQDVTDVVGMERDLRRSERLAAVGELSARMAHEIRNPLAAISGSIQILEGALEDQESEGRRLMEIVVREVDRLNHLISDFLQFARPGPLHTESVNVGDVVNEVLEMFEASRPRGVEARSEVEPGLRACADPSHLRQVLWNLVLNAAQAMPDGGLLQIVARTVRDAAQERDSGGRMDSEEKAFWADINVMDQGVGIAAEALDQVFEPFFTTKKGGSGLGLPTVHRIVEEHGGVVRLERGSGEWSTIVRVRLPRAEAA